MVREKLYTIARIITAPHCIYSAKGCELIFVLSFYNTSRKQILFLSFSRYITSLGVNIYLILLHKMQLAISL